MPVGHQRQCTKQRATTVEEKLTVPENATAAELEKFISETMVYMPRTIASYEAYQDFLTKQGEAVNVTVHAKMYAN